MSAPRNPDWPEFQAYLIDPDTGIENACEEQPFHAPSLEGAERMMRNTIREDGYWASEDCGPKPGDRVRIEELDTGDELTFRVEDES